MLAPPASRHVVRRFRCFGADCTVHVTGAGRKRDAAAAAVAVVDRLVGLHARFSRFDRDSELSRLNRDPHHAVRASAEMVGFVRAALAMAHRTGGLVDPTLARALARAGYASDLDGALPLPLALGLAPARRAARPDPEARWRTVAADADTSVVTRPPGVALDSGGFKGLFADWAGAELRGHRSFAIDCGGDLLLGGDGTLVREVQVDSPFDARVLHTFSLRAGGVATTGIGRRSWLDAGGAPAHHVLDPSTGRPAFTGLVQVTALAPTALVAEALAKAALLSGPDGAERWLAHGGVVVLADGSHRVVAPCA
jgi:thiamine biosynthesis lipoprotein